MKIDFILLKVTDDGPGIGEDIKTNVFTPFSTTKEIGKGLGLGLSLSHSLAKKMESDLYLEDTMPTTFVLKLKLVR